MAKQLDITSSDFDRSFQVLISSRRDASNDVSGVVGEIIANIRKSGFSALADYTKKFEGFELGANSIQFTKTEIDDAAASCDKNLLDALNFAADRIRSFHEKQLPKDVSYTDEMGVRLGWRWTAVEAAGLYAPGGRAAYPSSVLMNAIPAKVAKVDRLAMVTPSPKGEINPAVLAAAKIAGVDEVYRIGGAQSIAALAFGAGPIEPVDVIVGPGNAYVAEAKRQVFGYVGIDNIAGPSEILVVADGRNDPCWIAADLLSQAEHDPLSQCILITDDKNFAQAVEATAYSEIAKSSRREITQAAWTNNSAIIVVENFGQAPALINRVAPEHLELAVDDPDVLLNDIRHAGAIFVGRHTPEAVGDYVAGPDHVLPTAGGARHSSGLSVLDFLKRSSIIGCDLQSLSRIGPAAICIADEEGLPGHARSVRLRLE